MKRATRGRTRGGPIDLGPTADRNRFSPRVRLDVEPGPCPARHTCFFVKRFCEVPFAEL
jgi:hypothetical protein